jgi:hypothetical protein
MDLVAVSKRAPGDNPLGAIGDRRSDLAASIQENFRALAELLGRAAKASVDPAEAERLNGALDAARRGQILAESLTQQFSH